METVFATAFVLGLISALSLPLGAITAAFWRPSDRVFFIDTGEVQLLNPMASRARPSVLRDGDVFGALSCFTGALRSSTAVAVTDIRVWELRRCDLEDLLGDAPQFARKVRDFVQLRRVADYLGQRHRFDSDRTERWMRQALRNIDAGKVMPAAADASLEIKENHGAPMAIWLGITLDGIPESLVIGASLIESSVSYSLIAGLFLSNYPEALSSSTGMRQQGMSHGRILFMWVSLMLLTGLGAALGSQFFADAGPTAFALVEGLAAGAMLTMIAETMLPEAYFKGGSVVGMSTLMGFLVAIFFKTLE